MAYMATMEHIWSAVVSLLTTNLDFGFATMSPLKVFLFFGVANMLADSVRLVSSRGSD